MPYAERTTAHAALSTVFCLVVVVLCAVPSVAENGGGRAGDVLVVANREDPASMQIARAYCRARNLPPANLLALPFTNPITLKRNALRSELMDPLLKRWNALSPHPRYVVLVRGVPYRVAGQSTTGAILFDSLEVPAVPHGYYDEPTPFDPDVPWNGKRLRPATALTGYTVADTLALIENAQIRHPSREEAGTVFLCEGEGPRGVRNKQISETLAALRDIGLSARWFDQASLRDRQGVLGYFTGRPQIHIASNQFVRGAIAGNLTSFGGYLLDPRGHTSILSFVQHGVSGAYGTVVEPTNMLTRWPRYALIGDYAKGATLCDAYLKNLMDPTLGVLVGDPLCAPFAHPPSIDLRFPETIGSPDQAPESVGLTVQAEADQAGVSRVALWLDDAVPLFVHQSPVPAGTRCELTLTQGVRIVFERQRTLEQTMPLRDVLKGMAAWRRRAFTISPAGRFGDRLVFQVSSPELAGTELLATLVLDGPDSSRRFTVDLAPKPRLASTAVVSLGDHPPAAGDTVKATVGNQSTTVQAEEGESLADFARRVAEALGDLAKQAGLEQCAVTARLVPRTSTEAARSRLMPGVWLYVADPARKLDSGVPVRVSVRRSKESGFADGNSGPVKQVLRLRGETWGVLHASWPVASLEQQVAIDKQHLTPGEHTLTCIARDETGARRVRTLRFRVGPPSQRPELQVSRERLNLGDRLDLRCTTPETLRNAEEAYPVLYANAVPLPGVEWQDGETEVECRLPHFAPGPNTLQVEWRRKRPEAADSRDVLGHRSERTLVFVRRPLAYDASVTPTRLLADVRPTVTVTGPYLRTGVVANVADQTLPLVRDPDNGLNWTLELPLLPPGTYSVRLESNSPDDAGGTLDQELTVAKPKPKAAPPQ